MRKMFVLCIVLSAFLVGNPAPSTWLAAQGTSPYLYAYVVQQPGQAPDLILTDPVSASIVTVTIPTNIVVVEALLSPNGEWLALLPQSDLTNETIVLYHTSTGEIRLLTVDMELRRDPSVSYLGKLPVAAWSPDGYYLAYISVQNTQQDVFVYAPDTGSIVNLTNDAARHGSLTWGANHYLAIASEVCFINGCDISVEVFDFPNQTRVASVGVPERHNPIVVGSFCNLQLSPDNTQASFVRHCSTNPYEMPKETYIADFTNSLVIPLTNFTENGLPVLNAPPDDRGWHFAAYDTLWADNQTLLMGSSVGVQQPGMTEERTYRYDINNIANPAVLLEGLMAQHWAENSVSGQMAFLATVGYLEITSAQTQLADWDNNQLSVVATYPPGCNLLWSPDYRFLAYSRHDTPFSGCDTAVTGFYFLDTTDNTLVEQASTGSGFVFPAGWVHSGNELPTANAGPDQTIIDSDSSGSELVTLDGSVSTDTDGTIVSYSWAENGIEIATGVTPQVNLAVGVHTITLTVIDDDGAGDVDDVVITVEAPTSSCDTTIPASDTAALISAIATGNGAGAPYTICLTNSTYTLTAVDNSTDGSNGLPSITGDVTITGNGATITRDPAAASFRIFHVAELGSLTLENVTLSSGVATGTTSSGDGGAIRNLGTLTINNSTITGNSAGNDGGGVYSSGNLTISGSTISNNTAADDGGGVINEGTTATALIQNSMIQDNQATGVGGGVNNTDGTLTVTGTTVTTNTSSSNGGGVYNLDGTVNVSNSSITNNTANDFGGGLHDESGSTTLNQTTVSGNHALSNGGGVSGGSSAITIENNSFIASNNADNQGGGIFAAGSGGQVLIANSTVESNTSFAGGGIYISSSTVTIRTSIVRNNIVTDDAGGIRNSGTLIIEQGSSLTGNQSGDDGAGIDNSGDLTISGSIFSGNIAVDDGGGIYNTGSVNNSDVHGSCFEGNSADAGSGVFSTVRRFDATDNWWGAADGPSGSGSGSGDAVNGNVLFSPFLTTGCPVGGG